MHNQVPPDPAVPPPHPAADLSPQPYPPPLFHPDLPGDPPAVPDRGPNGVAIGALVAAVCGGPGIGTVLGFGLGIAALVQIGRRPQKGFGLAVAALIVSGLTLVIGVVVLTGVIPDEVRDRIAGITDVGTTELTAGDCISSLDDAERVHDMPVVPCTRPHKVEVFHVFRFPAGSYPGREAVAKQSGERCGAAFRPYDTPENEDLEIYYLFPEDEAGWNADRSVLCLAAAPFETRTTSILD